MEIGAWRLAARESSAGGRLSTKRKLRQIVVVSSHGHPEHANEVLTNWQDFRIPATSKTDSRPVLPSPSSDEILRERLHTQKKSNRVPSDRPRSFTDFCRGCQKARLADMLGVQSTDLVSWYLHLNSSSLARRGLECWG